MRFLTTFSLILFSFAAVFAQNNSYASSSNNQSTIQFEGKSPMPFQAFDMDGNTHFLPEYKGKVVVMAFWATGDEASRNQIKSLNQLKRDFNSTDLSIISLAQEDKSELKSFLKHNQIDYPVIPNSAPLGEAGYGNDLGISRIFVLDKNGLVQKVIITEEEEEMGTYQTLKPIVQDLMK